MMELLISAKTELVRSNVDRKHPFRFFTLATIGDFPEVRTVVKRNVRADLSIIFFTDSRSPKVEEIQYNQKVSALFYHPKKKLQVRIRGEANFIDSSQEDFPKYFEQIKQARSISDYTSALPPGTKISEFSAITHVEEIHFMPVHIQPIEIDVLQLDLNGHQRALYVLENDDWREIILTP